MTARPGEPGPILHTLRLWFAFRDPVKRGTYIASGLGLMAFKYAVDALLVYLAAGLFFSPLTYLSPIYVLRMHSIEAVPQSVVEAMAIFALPFMWIGVTMSVRRAVDAGYSAWFGVLFIAPVLNFITIIVLAVSPSKEGAAWNPHAPSVYRGEVPAAPELDIDSGVKSALVGVAAAVGIGLAMAGLSVVALRAYGRRALRRDALRDGGGQRLRLQPPVHPTPREDDRHRAPELRDRGRRLAALRLRRRGLSRDGDADRGRHLDHRRGRRARDRDAYEGARSPGRGDAPRAAAHRRRRDTAPADADARGPPRASRSTHRPTRCGRT